MRIRSKSSLLKLRGSPRRKQHKSRHRQNSYGAVTSTIVEGGLATMAVGRCILHLHEASASREIPPATAQIIRRTLRILSDPSQRPKDVIPVLKNVSLALHGVREPEGGEHGSPGRVAAEILGDAAALFRGNVVVMGGR